MRIPELLKLVLCEHSKNYGVVRWLYYLTLVIAAHDTARRQKKASCASRDSQTHSLTRKTKGRCCIVVKSEGRGEPVELRPKKSHFAFSLFRLKACDI